MIVLNSLASHLQSSSEEQPNAPSATEKDMRDALHSLTQASYDGLHSLTHLSLHEFFVTGKKATVEDLIEQCSKAMELHELLLSVGHKPEDHAQSLEMLKEQLSQLSQIQNLIVLLQKEREDQHPVQRAVRKMREYL